jgi:hypothetical protein
MLGKHSITERQPHHHTNFKVIFNGKPKSELKIEDMVITLHGLVLNNGFLSRILEYAEVKKKSLKQTEET